MFHFWVLNQLHFDLLLRQVYHSMSLQCLIQLHRHLKFSRTSNRRSKALLAPCFEDLLQDISRLNLLPLHHFLLRLSKKSIFLVQYLLPSLNPILIYKLSLNFTITSNRDEEFNSGLVIFLNFVIRVHLGAKPSKPLRSYSFFSKTSNFRILNPSISTASSSSVSPFL